MKILLTGSGGFIGKNILEAWKGKYPVDAPRSWELDLLKQEMVDSFFDDTYYDLVIHTAKIDDVKYKVSPLEILDANLKMFYHLERNSHKFGKMYYFGSGAEYNRNYMKPMVKEEDFGKFIPADPYGFAKYIMRKETQKKNNIYDFCLFGVYGKYEAEDRRFISNAICGLLEKSQISIHQNVFFDYLFIDDLINIMEYFLTHTPHYYQYNLCSGKRIDLIRLAGIIKEVSGSSCPILIEKPGLKKEYSGNNERLLKEIGGYDFITYENAVRNLYNYYKADRM